MNENKARFEALINSAVDGMVVIDAAGLVQVYNPACERLFGYGAAEVIGHNVKMLMPEPYHGQHDGYLQHYRDTREPRIIGAGREVVGRRKDGSTFPMYLSVGEGRLGESSIFVGIIHDISERKRAEQSLREREARLRSILETSPDAIIMIDEKGIVESFNAAAVRLFGYPAQEILGQNVSTLMPMPHREQHDQYLAHYRDTGEKRVIGIGRVVDGRRRDGTVFPLELAVGEIYVGARRLFTGFIRDITERREAEHRMQEVQSELLHVSRLSALGEMSAALAHELNQPLTAMANYVKAARRFMESIDHPDTGKIQEILDKAAGQTLRAGQIIRRLRNFVEKGETNRDLENLNKIVEEALDLATVGVATSGIKIKSALGGDIPEVMMDKIQIQQVILNLIRNAVDALQGAEIRQLDVSTARDGQTVVVAVADTGPGLSPEVAARLFQPFVTTKEDGLGIGLSICRSIIEAHQGRISAEARPSGGTIFRFSLPL